MYRGLRPAEKRLCNSVFNGSLPPYEEIGIGDGLGLGDRPWTDWGDGLDDQLTSMFYALNVGDYFSYDLSEKHYTPYDGDTSDLLVHEMTHVWQYHYGWTVKASSVWASTFGSYEFTPGDAWDDYNAEQQASIVEKWHKRGRKKTDELYPYIVRIIWGGGNPRLTGLKLAELAEGTVILPDPPTVIYLEPVDGMLLPILEKRYAANDVAGFGGRVRKLEEIFRGMGPLHAKELLDRLQFRKPGDKLSVAFHDHLSQPTITSLLNILRAGSQFSNA